MPYQKPPIGAKINFGHPLSNGLVGCWLFNEGSGDRVNDYSGYSNHGKVSNSILQTSTKGWMDGPDGPSMLLLDQQVDIPDTKSLSITGRITIMAWIRYTSSGMTNNPIVARWGAVGSYLIGIITKPAMYIRVGAVNKSATALGTYNNNLWHLCAGIYDGANVLLNMDGGQEIIVGAATTGPIDTNSLIVRIGCYSNSTVTAYSGYISSVFIYNRNLDAKEISYLYAFPYCMFDYQYPLYWVEGEGVSSIWTPRIHMIM
jgi:hypothetical protein